MVKQVNHEGVGTSDMLSNRLGVLQPVRVHSREGLGHLLFGVRGNQLCSDEDGDKDTLSENFSSRVFNDMVSPACAGPMRVHGRVARRSQPSGLGRRPRGNFAVSFMISVVT